MVDGISRIYTGQSAPIQPPEKPKKSAQTDEVRPSRSGPVAARLVPELEDKVEISEAGRAAAAEAIGPKEVRVPAETVRAVRDSWYSAGYTAARQAESPNHAG